MAEYTLAEAIERCPFRSVITLTGELDPILGAWAVMEGPALPVPERVFDDAADAFRRGGTFLILAKTKADRDAAKAALTLRFNAMGGRA